MPKVRIVFDRVRVEEKMLEQKAIELGHDTKMIDAKTTQINTESKKNNFDFGDVVIERCVSYFRGLHFTACLEFLDVPVINKFEVANNCGNKMLTSLLLRKHNVPTPKTYFSFSSDAALETLDKEGYPLVIKPITGSWGRGVMALKDRDTADAIVEVRELSDGPLDRIYYLQEMVRRPPRDIRAITVGEQVIAAMYRTSTDSFKTNIALGAEPIACEITKELDDVCVKASKAVGGGILGIDVMEDEKHGLVVHEINNTVEFKGLAKVAKRNIPKEMIEYAIASAIR
ncbi:MAG: lysine biosynthesis enzyme LysX [Thaumarchaeota archaeon 13_1_40CM_4_38_7]|nr:MAG: lysine biosynthesis enzyme LysX [Thaumarchaeota archaeon 13_1_40CM_4_38_7]